MRARREPDNSVPALTLESRDAEREKRGQAGPGRGPFPDSRLSLGAGVVSIPKVPLSSSAQDSSRTIPAQSSSAFSAQGRPADDSTSQGKSADLWEAVENLALNKRGEDTGPGEEIKTSGRDETKPASRGKEALRPHAGQAARLLLSETLAEVRASLEDLPQAGAGGEAQAGPEGLPQVGTEMEARAVSSGLPQAGPDPVQNKRFFIYSGDGPPPEERVEQDMDMLKDVRQSVPVRDLGRLKEFSEEEGEEDFLSLEPGVDAEEGEGIPWENPAVCGWVGGFAATLRGVMFKGSSFFASFSNKGSLAPGYLFFILMGYVCILGSLAWSLAAEAFLPGLLPLPSGRVALPVLLLLAPIALGLMQLFVVGCIRLVLLAFAPERADFGLVYKVVSYAPASFILCIVPFVGPPLAAVWFIVSLISGCRNALRLSWPLSLGVSLPPALVLLGVIVWYFL
jgi:hypothetical protein